VRRKAAILPDSSWRGLCRDGLSRSERGRTCSACREVASLGAIPVELSLQVIEEYQRMTQAQDYLIQAAMTLPAAAHQGLWGSRGGEHIAATGPRHAISTPWSHCSAPILKSLRGF